MITDKGGAAAGDVGDPDPALAAALTAQDAAAIATAFVNARVLVPVVATPADGEADMAVPQLVNEAGLRALPAFSGLAALRAWRTDARPVPMPGHQAVTAAADEAYDGLVVDVAGPSPWTFDRDDLRRLARIIQAAQPRPGC